MNAKAPRSSAFWRNSSLRSPSTNHGPGRQGAL
jgi:hypothetical protein